MLTQIGRAARIVGSLVRESAKGEAGMMGETRVERRSVELDGAGSVRALVSMSVGKLRVHGGAASLMEAEFTYNREGWRPEVEYQVRDGHGKLKVRHRDDLSAHGNVRSEWDVALGDSVPLDLHVSIGVGEARLELGELNLEGLSVEMGVGDTRLDLSGATRRDLEVVISGGVGQLTLVLPNSVGLEVRARRGIGSVRTDGSLHREGNAYVNDLHGKSEVTLRVRAENGVGEIEVRTSA